MLLFSVIYTRQMLFVCILGMSDATIRKFISDLKNNVYNCNKCGTLTSEYTNIGQWNCYEPWYHPLTGVKYKIPADHGSTRARPIWVISYEKAKHLPTMRKGAVRVHGLRQTVRYDVPQQGYTPVYYVAISRKKKETNIYRSEFLNL